MERLTFEGNFCEIARCECMKCPHDTECSQKQVWERLKQYVADKEGRVIVLPCKVGDTVFALLDNKSKYVSECEVKKIGLGDNIGFATIVPIGGGGREYGVSLRGFGKTFFLTREEAEKALAEMEGEA